MLLGFFTVSSNYVFCCHNSYWGTPGGRSNISCVSGDIIERKQDFETLRSCIRQTLVSHIAVCSTFCFSCTSCAEKPPRRKNLLHCLTLCLCFLSPLLLSISRTTSSSSSASSPYSDKHNAASVCLPCSSSGICALHKYLFASMVVLCWRREAGLEEGVCPPITACAIVFSSSETWSSALAHLRGSAPPILLLTCCPSLSTHHSVLLLSSSVTGRSLYCSCIFSLHCLSLRLTLLMFPPSPLQLSARVSPAFPSACQLVAWPSFPLPSTT